MKNATSLQKMSIILLAFLITLFLNVNARSSKVEAIFDQSHRGRFIRSLTSSPASLKDANREPYLEFVEEMRNLTLHSGEKAIFKCKVDGYPKKNMAFTWYKDNQKLNGTDLDPRIRIKNRELVSRLQISDVYSSDSGLYRCEASNVERRVHSSAYLKVSFNLLPDDIDTEIDTEHLRGKCEIYSGYACKEYMEDGYFYRESFQKQENMEARISAALEGLATLSAISSGCQTYAKKAFCYFVFPPCLLDFRNQPLDNDNPEAKKLCREDCDLLKHDICRKEFFQQNSNAFISTVVNEANCTGLPATTKARRQCTSIGLRSVVDRSHKCYNATGEEYRGTLSVTVDGNTCKSWPISMLSENPELSGGHNFCRNPGNNEEAPWCYVNEIRNVKEKCQVPQCSSGPPSQLLVMASAITVPAIFVLVATIVLCCICRRKKKRNVKHTKGIPMDNRMLSAKKAKVAELSSNLLNITGELGDGKFGKVFKAQILSNLHYCPNDPVAVKTLLDRATGEQVREFQLEIDTFSALQHPNVACMKAVIVQLPLRCMIFEHTNGVDLQEYLVMHSPQADFAKPPSSVSSHTSFIDHGDFVRMGIQIAAGMEYLTSSNFIHRDLAARNVLVCGNMDLKICNLGVVKDSYLTSYYRSPQGGQMLPIRWMAPESLHSWKFSDKSTVWSFGVVVWEMFSYGLQPYCGYSNHEVLDMISRRQLLSCPDHCPAKIYSLMQECWAPEPNQRPQFKDVHAKLVGFEGITTTRMTSQLAQGIHRQLNNVMRDGGSGQYGPQQRVDEMNRYMPYPYPGPPSGAPNNTRQYSTQSPLGVPETPPPAFNNLPHQQNLQFAPPHLGGGYPHPMFHNYNSAPSRSSGSVASSDFNRHQPLRVNNLTSHQEVPEPDEPLPPPPQTYYPPQSGRTSIENSSNADRSVQSARVNPQQQAFDELNDNQSNSRPNSRMRPDNSLPLSVYQEQERMSESSSPARSKPALAPKPPPYYSPTQDEILHSGEINRTDSKHHESGVDSGRNGEAKSRSCDSGLPCDDVDSEGADSHRPLLVTSVHPGLRPPYKHPSLYPSATSSMSGSTQVTADTRIL